MDAALHTIRGFSINAKSLKNKVIELRNFIDSFNYKLFFICETWIHDSLLEKTIHKQFHIYSDYRTDREGGGTLIGVHNSIRSRHVQRTNQSLEVTFVELVAINCKTLLCAVYAPPDKDLAYFEQLFAEIASKSVGSYENVIISGDVNIHNDWINCSIDRKRHKIGTAFMSEMISLGFTQLQNSPSYPCSAPFKNFDLLFSSNPDAISA